METSDNYQSGEQHRDNLSRENLEEKVGAEQAPSYKKTNNFLDYALPFSYQERFEQERRDILKFIPATVMNKFPVQGYEWLYGWTIRGTNQVNVRDDLYGLKKLETDIHECTHTPDEYETRRRTEGKMEALLPEEGKYGKKRKRYRV